MIAALTLPDSHVVAAVAAAAAGLGFAVWLAPRRRSVAAWVSWAGLATLAAAAALGFEATGTPSPGMGAILATVAIALFATGAVVSMLEIRAADRRALASVNDAESVRRELDRLSGMNVRLEDELQDVRRRLRTGDDQKSGSGAMLEATVVRQRKALEAANAQLRRQRSVFEGVIEGMALLERETLRLTDVNPSLARITGHEAKELTEKAVLDLLAPSASRPGKADLLRCTRERKPLHVSLLRKDGQEIPVELTISVVGAGEEAQLVAVIRDAAERLTVERDHEEAMKASRERARRLESENSELEERNRHLEDANRRLTEAGDRKDHYLSTVSHELRTPLTSIRSFSEILLRHGETEPAVRREFLEIIHKESERLTRLVNNVLDLARIEAGATRLRPSEFDARDVAGDAAQSMRGFADERRISIEVVPSVERPMRADRDRVQQLLMNLVGNALKHAPEDSRVTVEVGQGERPERILFTVRDQGPGIPAGELERVFDRFHRGEEEPGSAGTGLGLAICREIVTLHGGRIWAENAPGGGAVFRAEFAGVEEMRTRIARAQAARGASEPAPRLRPIGDAPVQSDSAGSQVDWSITGSLPPLGSR